MDSGETLNSSSLVGKSFNLYYPGMHVNKYGLVGIGDSSFSDTDLHHHLMVYGDVGVKDAVDLFQESDTTYTSPTVSIKNTGNKLQIKDTGVSDYVNVIGGPNIHAITVKTDTNYTILETDSTIIAKITSSSGSNVTFTLPAISSPIAGKIYTIKLIKTGSDNLEISPEMGLILMVQRQI